jgi:DNA topoisomerase-3
MMKRLVIAEKPSVAKDLASALGLSVGGDKKGIYENERYVVSSAVGHLVELYMPEDFDPKYRRWTLNNLPILPEIFLLKPIEANKGRFEELRRLMHRKDIEECVNACDAGREGELIFTYLYELSKCTVPRRRLWLSSMTTSAIRQAFDDLRPNEEMVPLQEAARCRAESDWLVGINGTRAVTGRMLGSRRREVASVGRVQTPTLSLVYERERLIQNFTPVPYRRIKGTFRIHNGVYEGFLQNPAVSKNGAHSEERWDRFWNLNEVDALLKEWGTPRELVAQVTETTKGTKQSPPRLYDLTRLQREANQRFGFSAKHTLDIAQALYEKHKVVTYPRTDSKALPEDYAPVCQRILEKLPEDYTPFGYEIIKNGWVYPSKKAVFDNRQVSDHFALIPTENRPHSLNENEAKIYDAVVRRFLSVFFPPAEWAVTTRLSTVHGRTFRTEGRELVAPGWLKVMHREETKEVLPTLVPADSGQALCVGWERLDEHTRPPARFTEATLLASMERAGQFVEDEELAEAMKDKGLGTPATRAQIIEHLVALKYLQRERKELIPTPKAEQLLEFIKAARIETLSSPALTGEWEHRLRMVQERKLSRTQFMTDIRRMTSAIVESILAFKEVDQECQPTCILSPSDGMPLVETFRCFRSQDNKVCIYKVIGNRKMKEKEIAELVKNKRVGPLTGFKSKNGKSFSAVLELTDDYKVKFNFDAGHDGSHFVENLETYPQMGQCPICKNPVHATEVSFVCFRHMNKECPFRVTRVLLGRTISDEQFKRLLADGKTDLIDRFRSRRTGKYFSAHLVLTENGTIGFEFVKRKKEESSRKTPKSKIKKSSKLESRTVERKEDSLIG